jgi:hypothetical protein
VAGLDEDTALDLTDALARHSLISLDVTDRGPRARMLETIRAFVAERLATRRDVDDIRRRHAGHYRALVEQADRPVRRVGQSEWVERLLREAGNTAAAVRRHLTNDRAPLPHLFRVLALFWALRDPIGDRRAWIDELLPDADSLDPQPRAELLWTAAMSALEDGDDSEALRNGERLAPLLDAIDDEYLEAVSHLVLAWTAPLVGDRETALREASMSVEQLGAQDEPFWSAAALVTTGALEASAGRYSDALGHLDAGSGLAETVRQRLAVGPRAGGARDRRRHAGPLRRSPRPARRRVDAEPGRPEHPHPHAVPRRVRPPGFAAGSAEPAARLAGAAEGLRRRGGMRTWPMMRQLEADVAAEGRRALGEQRFDQAFAAGLPLTQREAVAAAHACRTRARHSRAADPPAPRARRAHRPVARRLCMGRSTRRARRCLRPVCSRARRAPREADACVDSIREHR